MKEIKQFRKGEYMLHKDEPCRIKDIATVTVGTHNHKKVKLSLEGVFSSLNETFTLPPHERVEDVDIRRKVAQLLAKMDGKVQIMDTHSYETFDAEITSQLFEEANENDQVTYVEFNGKARVIDRRPR